MADHTRQAGNPARCPADLTQLVSSKPSLAHRPSDQGPPPSAGRGTAAITVARRGSDSGLPGPGPHPQPVQRAPERVPPRHRPWPARRGPESAAGRLLPRPRPTAGLAARGAGWPTWPSPRPWSGPPATVCGSPNTGGAGDVTFAFNSKLYADPNLTEGIDYARRHRRHERFDDTLARTDDVPQTTILAPHGGGIERGTSELCLAVAGYHPANLPQVPPAGVTYDYWMFEGIRETGNAALHVTSTGCDDGVVISLCAGSLHSLSVHGFDPAPEFPPRRAGRARWGCQPSPQGAPPGRAARCRHQGAQRRHGRRTRRRRPMQRRLPHPARRGPPAPPWAARSWNSAPRCATRCSPTTPALAAGTPPPRCSGPSWRCAATRSTGSRPRRSRTRPLFDVQVVDLVVHGAGGVEPSGPSGGSSTTRT